MKKISIAAGIILTTTISFGFDLGSIAKGVMDNVVTPSSTTTNNTTVNSSLNNDTISKGLKEALKNGVTFAVKELGAKDGYLNNSLVKIPLPDNLAKVETIIRKAGGEEVVNNLINSMNNAATTAAPKTANIFIDAINKMSLVDAQKILSGDNTAATSYFKTNTTESLKKMITPIIQESMKENQVAQYYKTANSFYKSNISSLVENSSTMAMAKSFGVDSYIPSSSDKGMEEYVSDKAIDGLFKMIAQKESAIRQNPIEQTTSILKQVFGQ